MPAASLSAPAKSSPPSRGRYALCGEAAAEARVVQDLARVSTGVDSEVGDAMRALVLVGAFARAEGGIVERDGEPHAADPGYELLALFKHRAARKQATLATMAATWTRLLNARVTIRALSTRDLIAPPATRFWFHAGRRQLLTLVGDPTLVSAIPRFDARELRADEPAFALCEGLTALACSSLDARAGDCQVVDRMQRAVLVCGDAMLLRRGQYADSLQARAEAVDATCTSAALRSGYREAIDYMARPDLWSPSASDVATWIASTRRWLCAWYLDAEAERIGTQRELLAYLQHGDALVAARQPVSERQLLAGLLRVLPSRRLEFARWHPPLERLLRASVALAFAPYSPAARQQAARLLRVSSAAHDALADGALLRGLRSLANAALEDGVSHPFMIFDAGA